MCGQPTNNGSMDSSPPMIPLLDRPFVDVESSNENSMSGSSGLVYSRSHAKSKIMLKPRKNNECSRQTPSSSPSGPDLEEVTEGLAISLSSPFSEAGLCSSDESTFFTPIISHFHLRHPGSSEVVPNFPMLPGIRAAVALNRSNRSPPSLTLKPRFGPRPRSRYPSETTSAEQRRILGNLSNERSKSIMDHLTLPKVLFETPRKTP